MVLAVVIVVVALNYLRAVSETGSGAGGIALQNAAGAKVFAKLEHLWRLHGIRLSFSRRVQFAAVRSEMP